MRTTVFTFFTKSGSWCLLSNRVFFGYVVPLSSSYGAAYPEISFVLVSFWEMIGLWRHFLLLLSSCVYSLTAVNHGVLIFLFFQYIRTWLDSLAGFILEICLYKIRRLPGHVCDCFIVKALLLDCFLYSLCFLLVPLFSSVSFSCALLVWQSVLFS